MREGGFGAWDSESRLPLRRLRNDAGYHSASAECHPAEPPETVCPGSTS